MEINSLVSCNLGSVVTEICLCIIFQFKINLIFNIKCTQKLRYSLISFFSKVVKVYKQYIHILLKMTLISHRHYLKSNMLYAKNESS